MRTLAAVGILVVASGCGGRVEESTDMVASTSGEPSAPMDGGDDVGHGDESPTTPAHGTWSPASPTCTTAPPRPPVTTDITPLPALGFRAAAPMHGPRYHHASVVIGGRLLVFGGNGSDKYVRRDQALIEQYDVHTDTWTTLGIWPEVGSVTRAIRLTDDKVLVVGDTYAGIFDPETSSWRATARPPERPATLVQLEADRVLANFDVGPASVWSRATDTWTPLSTEGTAHAVTARLADGRILFAEPTGSDVMLWNPSADLFLDGTIPLRIGDAVEALDDGRALVVGAFDDSDPMYKFTDFRFVATPLMVFDPAGKSCRTTWVPRTLRQPSIARLPSGRVILVDGFAVQHTSAYPAPNAIVVVDPPTGAYALYAPLAPLWPNVDVVGGKVVVTGGTAACGHGGCIDEAWSTTWVLDTPP